MGRPVEALIGLGAGDSILDLVRIDGTPLTDAEHPVVRVLATGLPIRGAVVGLRGEPALDPTWLRVDAEPRSGAGGAIALVVVTLHDVSERDRRVHTLEEIQKRLELAVIERTRTLALLEASLSEAREQNVTAEREARLALDQSQEQLRRVTEAIPGILTQFEHPLNGPLRFRYLSAGASELLGIDRELALLDAYTVVDRIHPDDRAVAKARFDHFDPAARHEALDLELRLRSSSSESWRWVRLRAVPEWTGQVVVWSAVVLDVTEQRQLAEQLRAAQRREAMGELAGGVAHNFNNLLAAILPNLEDALARSPPELRPQIEDALGAARLANDLVRRLLKSIRNDSPHTPQTRVDTVKVVRDVAALCRRSFGPRIAIKVGMPPESARILGRESDLHQALLNLCINARDAMESCPEPAITLEVQVRGEHVVLRVQDVGEGMSDEAVKRLGQPFFTTKAPGQGTGLGLATTYAITRELGGTIECVSQRGKGTSFTLRLPRYRGDQSSQQLSGAAAEPGFSGQRILLVDDEPLVRRALARHLRRVRLTPIEAASGPEALATLEALGGDVAVVLLDLAMPDMSGDEVLARISARWPAVPVVILSGHVADTTRLETAVSILVKPVEAEELTHTLRRMLEPSTRQTGGA